MVPSHFLFYLVQNSSIYVVSFYSLVYHLLVFIAFKSSKVRIYLNQVLIQAIRSRCRKILIGSCSLLQGKSQAKKHHDPKTRDIETTFVPETSGKEIYSVPDQLGSKTNKPLNKKTNRTLNAKSSQSLSLSKLRD